MAKTAIALYDKMSDAQSTVQDLTNNNFSRDEINMTMPGPNAERDAMRDLSDLELPRDDAMVYAEGVERGGTLVTVDTDDRRSQKAADILSKHNPVDIDKREEQWRREGWSPSEEGRPARAAGVAGVAGVAAEEQRRTRIEQPATTERIEAMAREEGRTFEEIQEEIRAGTRVIPRGRVLVHTRIIEEPVEKEVTVHEREVDVERRKVSRPATAEEREMLGKAGEETYEFTEMGEEAIISKEARVVGEVEVEEEVTEHPERVRGTVRRREVDVERTGEGRAEGRMEYTAFESYDDAYRRHFDKTYGSRGVSYDTYRPAYRYGYDLATSSRYRDQSWSDIESDVRSRWEDRNPGTWNDYKDAIQEGWREAHAERQPMR